MINRFFINCLKDTSGVINFTWTIKDREEKAMIIIIKIRLTMEELLKSKCKG